MPFLFLFFFKYNCIHHPCLIFYESFKYGTGARELLSLRSEPKPIKLQWRDNSLAADGQNWLSSTINISMHSVLKGEFRAGFNYSASLRNKRGLKTRYWDGLFSCSCIQKRKSTGLLSANTQIPDTHICMGHDENNLYEVSKMLRAFPYIWKSLRQVEF